MEQIPGEGHTRVRPVQYGNTALAPPPFVAIPSWWRRFAFRVLSARELSVYLYVCTLLKKDGLAYPSHAQIANDIGGMSSDTIARAMKRLTYCGLLIRNTQRISNFQRTVYQRPAPEFTLIRLLETSEIDARLFPPQKAKEFYVDELDTTESAVQLGLRSLLENWYAQYANSAEVNTPRGLIKFLSLRFQHRAGKSYPESWAELQRGEEAQSVPTSLTYDKPRA